MELYHGQTLKVVIILFRDISLQYIRDLVDLLLMFFDYVIRKAGVLHISPVYIAMESGNFV
jgi:hypothetical protein